MSLTAYPALRLRMTPEPALKLRFLPGMPGPAGPAGPQGPPGPSGGAPLDAEFLVRTASAGLSAERIVTDTATVTWDFSTAGQAKANATASGAETQRHVKQFGAVGNGSTDDTAAIQAAIDATPYGGRLRIPEGNYLVSGSGTAIFTRNTPINIWGDGPGSATIVVANTVPNTRDVFRFAPAAGGAGWSLRNFAISGQGGSKFGRHAIFLDTPTGLNYNWDIVDMQCLPLNGNSIRVNNIDPSGGIAYSAIMSSNLESIYLGNVGDGIMISNNNINASGSNAAIYASQVTGAGNMLIENNVIVGTAGHILIDSGVQPIIVNNELETPVSVTNTYGWMIDLMGGAATILAPVLLNNQIQALPGTSNPVPVRVNNASSTKISGGRISVVTGNHIFITGFASHTSIDRDIQYVTNNIISYTPATVDSGLATTFAARKVLAADRTYYVAPPSASPAGSNNNTGLSAADPLATWQEAWTRIASLDTNGFNVTVQIADGTYTGTGTNNNVTISKWWVGGGMVTFQGNATTPANVLLNVTSAHDAFLISDAGAGILRLKDFKIQTAGGDHIHITAPVSLQYGNLDFGTAGAGAHIRSFHPGFKINMISSYKITGGATSHWLLYYGVLESAPAMTITITGTLAFNASLGFVFMDNNAKAYLSGGMTIDTSAATVTGKRHTLELLCEMQTNGKDPLTFFPGNVAGTVKLSSVFA